MNSIDTKKYWIKEDNYYKTQTVKTQIVIGFSMRKNNYHIIRLQHKEFGKSKNWNTFTIDRMGNIYQHYDTKYHTDFLGIKEADKKIISIVLENMGCLFKNDNDLFVNWLGELCDSKNVVEKKWLGCDYWEDINEQQLISTAELCNFLCDKHNIPNRCIDFNLYHADTIKYKGIVFRTNYISTSSDFTPLFEIDKFIELLSKKS